VEPPAQEPPDYWLNALDKVADDLLGSGADDWFLEKRDKLGAIVRNASHNLRGARPSPPPAESAARVRELEWVLNRAEEIVGYEHGKDAAYSFTQAWGELPKDLQTPLKPIEAASPPPATPQEAEQ
jgi:hypothetical protein